VQFKIKYSKEAANKLRYFFNIMLFGVLCAGIGVLCTLFILAHIEAEDMKRKARQMVVDVNRCAEVAREYTENRDVIMQQFADMEARFTRIEHLMRIPRAERHGAWKKMREEWAISERP